MVTFGTVKKWYNDFRKVCSAKSPDQIGYRICGTITIEKIKRNDKKMVTFDLIKKWYYDVRKVSRLCGAINR